MRGTVHFCAYASQACRDWRGIDQNIIITITVLHARIMASLSLV